MAERHRPGDPRCAASTHHGQRGGRNRPRDPRSSRGQAFKGERRRRETHESTTAPEARLYRKGKRQEARLCYPGHVLTENRHGLVVDVELTEADPWSSQVQAATPNGTPH